MTPNDLITLALKQAGVTGVGQTPAAEDINDAFTVLNMMMGQWSRRRWLIYHLIDVSKVATGATSYTIGLAGDFNVARPDRIQAAFVRVNGTDYPLALVTAREDYNLIALKTLAGFPRLVFLDSDYPLGRVYPWPVPDSRYQLHLTLKEELPGFVALNQTIALPPEYQEALIYNLAARLRPLYQLPPEPTITALARAALNTVVNSNAQIPLLKMPLELLPRTGYNIYTDRIA